MAGGGHGTRAASAALMANVGIAVAKFVGAKVSSHDGLGVAQLAEVVNRAETSVRGSVPEARVMCIAPDGVTPAGARS